MKRAKKITLKTLSSFSRFGSRLWKWDTGETQKIQEMVGRIRRGKTALSRGKGEAFRESLARELVARKFILPRLKARYGANLLAVLQSGSSQPGIRKSTRKQVKPPSDLDLIAIFSEQSMRVPGHTDFIADLCLETQKKFGFPLQFSSSWPERFGGHYTGFTAPPREAILAHNTIYGKAWMDEFRKTRTPNWKKEMPELRQRLTQQEHYQGRE